MTAKRAGTAVVSIVPGDEATFATKSGTFEDDKEQIVTWDVTTNLNHGTIENQAARVADLGKHENGVGLIHTDGNLTFSTYCYGLGSAYDGGVSAITPPVTPYMALIGACLGFDPSTGIIDADTAENTGSSTTAVVCNEDNSNIYPAAGNRFLIIEDQADATKCHVRPVLSYNTGTNTAALALALPAIPADGDVIYGCVNAVLTEDANYTIQGDVLKRNTTTNSEAGQNYEFFGAVGSFSLPETNVTESQVISFDLKVADATRYNEKVRVAPSSRRPQVAAGGTFILAKYGQTVGLSLKFLNVGVELARTYTPDPRANKADGIGAWVVTDQGTSITLHVHDDESLPTGFTAANFHECFTQGGDQNRWHLLLVYGNRQPGFIFAEYFPKIQLDMEPEDVDVNGLQAMKLTFSLCAGGTEGENKLWVCQG